MPFLELAAILLALRSWRERLIGATVVVYSDCMPAVEAIRKAYSPVARMMSLIREIVSLALQHQFVLRFVHIPNPANVVADAISRSHSPNLLQQLFPWLLPVPDKVKCEQCTS